MAKVSFFESGYEFAGTDHGGVEEMRRAPCIRHLRIRVTDILGMLADGVTHQQILKDFPCLEPDDIKAALAFAALESDHAS